MLNCYKYVMNGSHWKLVNHSTFCNQYIAFLYHPYKPFHQFYLGLYSTQTSYCFCLFSNAAYCHYLVTKASRWHHNGYQCVTKEAVVWPCFPQWLIWIVYERAILHILHKRLIAWASYSMRHIGYDFYSGWIEAVYERFSAYKYSNLNTFNMLWWIMIEYNLIPPFRALWCYQWPWEAHHGPRVLP